jgi:hypothetical protein
LLNDPLLGVRTEVGRILSDIPDTQIPASDASDLRSALQEYVAILE